MQNCFFKVTTRPIESLCWTRPETRSFNQRPALFQSSTDHTAWSNIAFLTIRPIWSPSISRFCSNLCSERMMAPTKFRNYPSPPPATYQQTPLLALRNDHQKRLFVEFLKRQRVFVRKAFPFRGRFSNGLACRRSGKMQVWRGNLVDWF